MESFSRNRATGVAFKGIVGSGANAVLPHYQKNDAEMDSRYWNLGVRIEDTYIVTETGWEEITSYPRRPY